MINLFSDYLALIDVIKECMKSGFTFPKGAGTSKMIYMCLEKRWNGSNNFYIDLLQNVLDT